jgi:Fe-S cluster assembly protein SufD
VDTKPQLEIYADDVKCSHGATVGRIDDEQMFYLRSRGIDQQAAQKMIIYAFAAELTEAICDDGSGSRCWRVLASVCREAKHEFFR